MFRNIYVLKFIYHDTHTKNMQVIETNGEVEYKTIKRKYTRHKPSYQCDYVITKGEKKDTICCLPSLHLFTIDENPHPRCSKHSPKRMIRLANISRQVYSEKTKQ